MVIALLAATASSQYRSRREHFDSRFLPDGTPRPGSSESGLRRSRKQYSAPRAGPSHARMQGYAGRTSPDGRWRAAAATDGDSETVTLSAAGGGARLTFGAVARLWREDRAFGLWFASVLAASPYAAFYWECPPVDARGLDATLYEHKTVESGGFAPASPLDFGEHLGPPCAPAAGGARAYAAAFPNLGGDAYLVAPCDAGAVEDAAPPPPPRKDPRGRRRPATLNEKRHAEQDRDAALAAAGAARARAPLACYGHVGAFVRGAPPVQVSAFFSKVGDAFESVLARRGDRPVWLSTEGSGVPWLHVRLDSRPKYYHTRAYRAWPRPPGL